MATIVFHQAALGDWVITFPILRALVAREDHAATTPDRARVFAVTSRAKAALAAKLIPGVQPVDIEQRDFTRLHADGAADDVSPATRKLLASATTIISFVSDGRDAWARNVAQLALQASIAFIDPRPRADDDGAPHVTDQLVQQLTAQGLALSPIDAAPRDNPAGPVVIHPGSGGAAKCWPPENYAALINHLINRNVPTRVIWGEVEEERWPKDRLSLFRDRYAGRPLTTLDDLHAALADARLYIGNDAGPTHLAAAMGLRTVAIFTTTSPDVWRPRGRCTVLRKPTVEEVVRSIV